MATRNVAVLVGSLRKGSYNRMMAHALAALAPPSLKLDIVEIGALPLYNQDDEATPPAAGSAPIITCASRWSSSTCRCCS